jgi:hypothetical protein
MSDSEEEPCSKEAGDAAKQQQEQHTITYIRARRRAEGSTVITCAAIECIGSRLLLLHQADTTLDPCALEIFSDKGDDDVGGHGEGLKVAALEAYRNGYEIMLLQNREAWSFAFVKNTSGGRMGHSR